MRVVGVQYDGYAHAVWVNVEISGETVDEIQNILPVIVTGFEGRIHQSRQLDVAL